MRSWRFVVVASLGLGACTPGPQVDRVDRSALTGRQIYGDGLPPRTVVLTYDDGPDQHTLELAHYLADNGVPATFFVNGRRFCKTDGPEGSCLTPPETRACQGPEQAAVATPHFYPEAWLDEVLALGHRVGNHTQDHCYLTRQTAVADLTFEVKTTQEIIDRHVCGGPLLFRAPYGAWNAATAARVQATMASDRLVGPINWDVDGEDWDCWQKGTSPERCADQYLDILMSRPEANGIFLMHDRPEFNVGYEGPLLMAKILLPRLKAAGFRFAAIDEVLGVPTGAQDAGCGPAPVTVDAGSTPSPTPPADGGLPPDATPVDATAPTAVDATPDLIRSQPHDAEADDQPPVPGGPGAGPVTAAEADAGGCSYGAGAGSPTAPGAAAWLLPLLALLRRRRRSR